MVFDEIINSTTKAKELFTMDSGIYIVTLSNEEPISVNAQDFRIAHKAISKAVL